MSAQNALREASKVMIGKQFRQMFWDHHYPWQSYMKLFLNDSLSYNAQTGRGGLRAGIRFR